ncbi:MAG: hypothetical protein M3220_16665 [Chloroflexota bacterium]|nr:hypothetical protein [Chloroflexota bacterium]
MEAFQFAQLRSLSTARKLALLSGLNRSAFQLAYRSLPRRHPNESEAELRYRMVEMMHGREWADRLYGDEAPTR